MDYLNNTLNIIQKLGKIVLIVTLITLPLFNISSGDTFDYIPDERIQDVLPELASNNLKINLINNYGLSGNRSFDMESLLNYTDSLYKDEGIFLEADGGYATSIATYEALSILRILGLDFYFFGSDWGDKEKVISNKLRVDLKDKTGYLLSESSKFPSLEGSFGVINSLLLMNELEVKLITADLLDFVYNTTFDRDETGFHEVGQEISIKATFQALSILDSIRNANQEENETVLEIMRNYSVNILNFINSKWVNNSHFDSHSPYRTPIEDTWHALQSINILERYGKLSNSTNNYSIPVVDWLKSLIKTSGPTKGGFGTLDCATVAETGMSYAILHLLNATEKINSTETADAISFIYSSQFLERENRTYRTSELAHIGGFGPNNLTYRDSESSKQVNIRDSYYAALTLLLTEDIFNSINLTLETTHYQEIVSEYPGSINKSNYIIQGKLGFIEQYFTIYNYKSHGSLKLRTIVDNWTITHPGYTENDEEFYYGKSDALYVVNLENDSQSNFNWTLGSHRLTNIISIRNLPFIHSPVFLYNSTLFVGYANEVKFDPTVIKPGDNVNTTIFYQNRSVLTYSILNITDGNVSAYLKSPNSENYIWDLEPINTTIGAIQYTWNVPEQALLGTWELTLIFNQSNFISEFKVQIEVTDTVFFYNMSQMPQYYPGEDINLNISLKYTNGNFTPNANALLAFISNQTQKYVFNLTLEHSQGNTYTTRGRKCPTRFLYGSYNVSVRLTWNTSSELPTGPISNSSLPVINIKGIPTISKAFYNTDYRNITILEENNLLYYGETINLSLTIGFKSNSAINNVTDENVVVRGGLVNNSQPSSFIQLFQVSKYNKILSLSGLINTNLPNTTFGTRFYIQSEWNNSYLYLRNPIDSAKYAAYNLSLKGTFVISDINYVTTEISDELFCYALDTTSVISVSFKVCNSERDNIPVPSLNLYGILDIKGRSEILGQSLPSITSAVDHNGTTIYFLSIPTSSLNPNEYEISIYTWSAISSHLKVGQLLPGFKIIKTSSQQQIIQPHEALILVVGLIFIILAYLNLKKLR
ncbi:MAG: prenyltransferase/squalene oxidase repeat-containing protein [Candidatus Hodarchaeales archaeon]